MTESASERHIRDYVERVWNQRDPDALDDLVTPDYRRHMGPLREPLDAAGQKARVASFQAAFPDLRFEVADVLADDDRVAFRLVVRGTHQAELMGVPATGAAVAIEAVDIVRLEGGKIAEHWGVVDLMSLRQQLGAARA